MLSDAKLFIIIDLKVSCALDWFPCCFILLAARFPKVDPRLGWDTWAAFRKTFRLKSSLYPLNRRMLLNLEDSVGEKRDNKTQQAARQTAPVCGAAGGLNGYELSLPSTLVRVSTGLLQADSGATLAECFFMMMSSDGLSSKPLRLHPWSWFGADTRPLDGTLDVSRAGLLLSVPSHPSNSLLMFFFLPLPCPPTPFLHLPSLLKSAVSSASWLVSPHVQFGNCCNSPTSHIHQTPPQPYSIRTTSHHPPPPPPPCPEAGAPVCPPRPPVAVVPPGQRKLCVGLTGRRHWPGSAQANSAL